MGSGGGGSGGGVQRGGNELEPPETELNIPELVKGLSDLVWLTSCSCGKR